MTTDSSTGTGASTDLHDGDDVTGPAATDVPEGSHETIRPDLPVPGEPIAHPWRRVLHDQRKTLWVALGFMVAAVWIIGPLGRWELAGCVAGGVALGLGNHLALERWLLRTISEGRTPSRNEMMRATLARLAILTVVAVGAAAAFWPDGIGLLLGLAIFRLVALAMTSITLLKELKSQ